MVLGWEKSKRHNKLITKFIIIVYRFIIAPYKTLILPFLGLVLISLSCANQQKEEPQKEATESTVKPVEVSKIQELHIEPDSVYLAQLKNAWENKQLLPATLPNELVEVKRLFRFTGDTIPDYLVVSRMSRHATAFIVDGKTGVKLVGDTLSQFEAENMFWTRPGVDGLKFNLINATENNQYDLEVYHTWKLETSTTREYYVYHYDENTTRVTLIEKKTLSDEDRGRFGN